MSRKTGISAALLALALVAASAPPVVARTERGSSAVLTGCRERFVIAPGDDAAVRALVPAEYDLARDAAGSPLLYVTAITCDAYRIGGTTAPTTAAAFAAMVRSPDGVGCTSGWPVVGAVKGDALSCNLYVLFAAYDNPAVVAWLRAGTPDLPVHLVRDLDFREGAFDAGALGSRLEFRAGRPVPSPFVMDAVVREREVAAPFTATFWASTSSGTVRIRFESEDLALGEAEGVVRPAPRTEMARLMGDGPVAGAAPFTLIAGNHWGSASLTKEVLASPAG